MPNVPDVLIVAAALIGSAAVAWGANRIASELRNAMQQQKRAQVLTIAQLFAPAIAASQTDPRAILTSQPLARALRGVLPDAFDALDRASGATFPFTSDRIQAAHAQWTAEWLTWERAHDAEYKARAADAQEFARAPRCDRA